MQLSRRIAAIVAASLLTLTPVTTATHAGSTPNSVANDGSIIVET